MIANLPGLEKNIIAADSSLVTVRTDTPIKVNDKPQLISGTSGN
jgi:hypothetical protein